MGSMRAFSILRRRSILPLLPGSHLDLAALKIRHLPIEALSVEYGEFDLSRVRPRAMLLGV